MSNNKSNDSDLEVPLLGGSTATADNNDSLKNTCLNRLIDSVSRNLETLILSAKNRADLKNKLLPWSVEGGQSEEFLQSLPTKIRKRVEVLLKIQGQHDKFKANLFMEMAALEAKYQKLYAPLYKKRFDIVNGVVEVEGVSGGAIVDKNGDTYIDVGIEDNKDGKGVPNFWLTAMMANEFLADEIQERDEEALKYLKDIKWCRVGDLKGFKLEFFFDANPYFKNTVLTKKFEMDDEEESILDMIGTEIKWLPGKNLTQKVVKKVPKKGSKNTKPITKTEECESFFNFFNPPQFPDSDDDDETAEDLQGQIEQDYAIGKTIREEIIPHAVSWFTRGIDEEY